MKIALHSPQWKVFRATERFRVLVAGRRFGKTYLALTELCRGAAGKGRMAWYVAPTYKMAKRIAWKPLKEMTRPFWASKPNENDLRIELVGGGTICLRGADNYDSLRGDGLDFLVLDEYASIAPAAWTEVLRAALADRLGRALFIGTPQGHNHFHDLVERPADPFPRRSLRREPVRTTTFRSRWPITLRNCRSATRNPVPGSQYPFLEFGLYSEQLSRYLEQFGENVLIGFYEDFKTHP